MLRSSVKLGPRVANWNNWLSTRRRMLSRRAIMTKNWWSQVETPLQARLLNLFKGAQHMLLTKPSLSGSRRFKQCLVKKWRTPTALRWRRIRKIRPTRAIWVLIEIQMQHSLALHLKLLRYLFSPIKSRALRVSQEAASKFSRKSPIIGLGPPS